MKNEINALIERAQKLKLKGKENKAILLINWLNRLKEEVWLVDKKEIKADLKKIKKEIKDEEQEQD